MSGDSLAPALINIQLDSYTTLDPESLARFQQNLKKYLASGPTDSGLDVSDIKTIETIASQIERLESLG